MSRRTKILALVLFFIFGFQGVALATMPKFSRTCDGSTYKDRLEESEFFTDKTFWMEPLSITSCEDYNLPNDDDKSIELTAEFRTPKELSLLNISYFVKQNFNFSPRTGEVSRKAFYGNSGKLTVGSTTISDLISAAERSSTTTEITARFPMTQGFIKDEGLELSCGENCYPEVEYSSEEGRIVSYQLLGIADTTLFPEIITARHHILESDLPNECKNIDLINQHIDASPGAPGVWGIAFENLDEFKRSGCPYEAISVYFRNDNSKAPEIYVAIRDAWHKGSRIEGVIYYPINTAKEIMANPLNRLPKIPPLPLLSPEAASDRSNPQENLHTEYYLPPLLLLSALLIASGACYKIFRKKSGEAATSN